MILVEMRNVKMLCSTALVLASWVDLSSALRCLSCVEESVKLCKNGTAAAKDPQLTAECRSSQPYCEVTTQHRLRDDGEPEPFSLYRGCAETCSLSCTNKTRFSIRECRACCQGDLCNSFEDAPERVMQHELEEEEAANTWVLPLVISLVVVAIAGAMLAGFLLWRRGSRQKQRASVSTGQEAGHPLNQAHAAD